MWMWVSIALGIFTLFSGLEQISVRPAGAMGIRNANESTRTLRHRFRRTLRKLKS